MINLEFDIQTDPPTAEEIALERTRLRKRKRSNQGLMITATLVIAGAYVGAILSASEMGRLLALNSNDLPLLRLGVMIFGFAAAVSLLAWLGGKIPEVQDTLSGLEDVTPEHKGSEDLLKACRFNPDCDQYNLALVRQGRRPVVAEKKAMIAWHQSQGERMAEQRLQSGKSLFVTGGNLGLNDRV